MGTDFRALGKTLEPDQEAPEKTKEDVQTGLDFLRFLAGLTEIFVIEMPKSVLNVAIMALPEDKPSQNSDDQSDF